MPLCGALNGQFKHYHTKKNQTMESMTRFLCLPAADPVRHTLQAIGLVFVLGCTTTHAGWLPPQPLTTYERLVSREIPDSLILSQLVLSETTTNPCLKLPLPMDPSYREFQHPSQSGIAVSNTTGHGSTSSAHSTTLTRPTTACSSRCVLKTPALRECSKSSPQPQSQKSLLLTLTKEK